MARELTDDEATFLGALTPEQAAAHRRGKPIQVTAEQAAYFRHQMDLAKERAFDEQRREVRAWRERFPKLYYRSADDCIDRRDP